MSVIAIANRGSNHRGSMENIMGNTGFGALRIFKPTGAIIEVPQNLINSQGLVKSGVMKDLDGITREKAESLEKRGVKLFVRGVE